MQRVVGIIMSLWALTTLIHLRVYNEVVMNMKFKEVIENNTKSNKLVIENKKIIEKNKRLVSDVVFLTKQVSDRDVLI